MTRIYPDETAGPFPTPPRTVVDDEGREIALRAHGDDRAAVEALVEMYADFDPADRAQGLPPVGETRIRDWLAVLLADEAVSDGGAGDADADGINVLAWHGDDVVGHATLVADADAYGYELAIFVHQAYQGAGIGTALLRTLLGYGADRGVERVWLTVERWNHPAIALYEKVGFETSSAESFEREMALRLDPSGSVRDGGS